MPKGTHKNSLSNLTHEGRPLNYDEPKKTRRLSVTESGWTRARTVIDSMGMSVSEFVEQLGRGQVIVMSSSNIEAFQDALDSALLRQAIAETNGEFASLGEVLAERELTRADLNG
jgi:hypothetical protein